MSTYFVILASQVTKEMAKAIEALTKEEIFITANEGAKYLNITLHPEPDNIIRVDYYLKYTGAPTLHEIYITEEELKTIATYAYLGNEATVTYLRKLAGEKDASSHYSSSPT